MAAVRRTVLVSIVTALSLIAALWLWSESHLLSNDRHVPYEIDRPPNHIPCASVGIDLAPSSGTIAIDFGNGTVWTHHEEGSAEFREVMARLSLLTSRHRAPPYSDNRQRTLDFPRQALRSARKRLGLPASADVGTLASVVQRLRTVALAQTGVTVEQAAVAVPQIVALYQDDVQDVCAYAGMEFLNYADGSFLRPILWDAPAAFAGYGLGVCEQYQDPEQCEQELIHMPRRGVLAVHYAPNALGLTCFESWVAPVHFDIWPGAGTDFTLGSEGEYYPEGSVNETHWQALSDTLDIFLRRRLRPYPVDTVLFTGDSAMRSEDDRFVKTVLNSLMNARPYAQNPEVFFNDSVFAAAKGAAGLVKRDIHYMERMRLIE